MDRLKMARLARQDAPRKAASEKAVMALLVYAWEHATALEPSAEVDAATAERARLAGLSYTSLLTAKGRAALNVYYLAHAAIFCRPAGSTAYSDDEMLSRARRAATSADALASMVEELLLDASEERW